MKLNLLWIFAVILLCATRAECDDMNGRTKTYESIPLRIFIFAVAVENDEESKIMIWLRLWIEPIHRTSADFLAFC